MSTKVNVFRNKLLADRYMLQNVAEMLRLTCNKSKTLESLYFSGL